jgi:hypothetical protein
LFEIQVTFEEARAHLGVETQRQWSDKVIARTTPILFGLYSLVTPLAYQWAENHRLPVRMAAWYTKDAPPLPMPSPSSGAPSESD